MMIIYPDGKVDTETTRDGTLEQLQKIVGGYIQIVFIEHDKYQGIICNENGKVMDPPLEVNHHATGLVKSQLLPNDFLVGPIIFFEEGEVE